MKHFNLITGLLSVIVSTVLLSGVFQHFGVDAEQANLIAGAISVLSGFVSLQAGSTATMLTASIDAFKASFGSYYHPRGQNINRLRRLLTYDDSVWNSQFSLTPLEGDTLEYGIMSHDRVLQPFKPYWSPTGQLSGSPRRFTLQRVKMNVAEIPDHLVNTWLGFLTTEGGKDPNVNRTTWPFVRWYIEVYLLKQARNDQYQVAFCGDWVDPGTNGTAGALIESFNGLNYNIKVDVASGDLPGANIVATGALETNDELFVDQTEDMIEQISDKYRGQNMTLNMHDTYFQSFKRGNHAKYNVAYKATDKLTNLYFRPNISVVGHFNMTQTVGGTASEKMWITTQDNAIKGSRIGSLDADSVMKVESVDYQLKLFSDWHVQYGYWDPRIVWINDRENS